MSTLINLLIKTPLWRSALCTGRRKRSDAGMKNQVESGVANLVEEMNAAGLVTYASCHGHTLFWGRAILPYVAFRTENIQLVKALAFHLRRDSECEKPVLRWGWSIGASFDADLELAFRLQPDAPHRWVDSYREIPFRSDLQTIRSLLRQASSTAKMAA